ncbi:MAG: hypothetical protein ABIQ88_02280 [Chitinophagaceae bacterium]
MTTIFGNKLISSISYSNDEILESIIHLYAPGGIELDGTYGYGHFYKKITKPKYKFDTHPKAKGVTVADCRAMPLDSNSILTAVFDPPFVISDHKKSAQYIMMHRYRGFKTVSELREMYRQSVAEYFRVLKPGGILIVKCQDMSHGHETNYFIHNEVFNMAMETGFKAVDLFIMLAKNRFLDKRFKQKSARKFHCYFWVFKKRKRLLK